MITSATITVAFFAGLISFIAPCLLPLLPTYFSVITGFTFSELYGLELQRIRSRIFISGLFFALGFSLIFTVLGATGSIVGRLFEQFLPLLLRLNGAFLIGLGLIQTGIVKINSLQFDFAWKIQKRLTHLGYLTAFATGIASALSWIPCIGPLLSPILLLAAQSDTVISGAFLLFVYSLGLTLPFMFIGLFFPVAVTQLYARRPTLHRLSQGAGVFLILFGGTLLLNRYREFIDFFSFFRLPFLSPILF